MGIDIVFGIEIKAILKRMRCVCIGILCGLNRPK